MKAIILDGQLKSALSTVRSLGEKGVEFSVGAERGTAIALHSRYTKKTFTYPSPEISKEKFVDKVIGIQLGWIQLMLRLEQYHLH